jgi:hypothetical protein
MFTAFGVGPDDELPHEGPPEVVYGPVAIFIHGDPRTKPTPDSCHALAEELARQKIHRILVFGNTDEPDYFGAFFGGFRGSGVLCIPQLLGDLGYSILTATIVYLEFRHAITWKWTTYLS